MEVLELQTNLHCEKCVAKIKPHFDQDPAIENWAVDLTPDVKTVKVEGGNITEKLVADLLSKEGYKITGQKQNISNFWGNIKKWRRASFNTLNCLIGCTIGDFGMIIFLQAYYPDTPMIWQMILAIIAGLFTSILLETTILRFRESFNWKFAFKTAFGMSFISMVGMEIAMNTTDFMITGGKAAFHDPMYWTALLIALIAGFIAPLPYNYYKLAKHDLGCH
jgi:cation transport ATPase